MIANANVRACADCTSACEGTTGPLGYHALFGYRPDDPSPKVFMDMSDHPRLPFLETRDEFIRDGKTEYTTAAGRYQITEQTWDRLVAKWKRQGVVEANAVVPFNEAWQDYAFEDLLRELNAWDDAAAGRLSDFMRKCGGTWASLPSAGGVQGHRTMAFAQNAYTAAGGTLA